MPGSNFLDHVAIDVQCVVCGSAYPVTARQILAADDMVRCGCQADDRECLPLAYADVVDVEPLRKLAAAWRELEAHAARRACSVRLVA